MFTLLFLQDAIYFYFPCTTLEKDLNYLVTYPRCEKTIRHFKSQIFNFQPVEAFLPILNEYTLTMINNKLNLYFKKASNLKCFQDHHIPTVELE